MKTKVSILLVTLLFPVTIIHGQFLHLGVKAFVSPYQKMSFFQYDVNDYVYYFSNEYNETIRFNGFQASETKSYVPFPNLFIKYELGNHLFFQFDVFTTWNNNEAKYKNSVDFPEYAEVFNPDSELPNLGYNSIKLKWWFIGNSLTAGYSFFKTKRLRPYIYGGLSTYYLMNLKPGDYYKDTRGVRNDIIFKNLGTYRNVSLFYKWGAGIKFQGISVDVFFENNLGEIDENADYYNDEITLESYNNRPNYKSYRTINVALSVNLLSFNLSKKQSLK